MTPLCPATRHQLATLRRFITSADGGGRLKVAADGGQDSTFEQAFSNLAHSFLREKTPSLMPYEVGFQLLERSEDSNKAVAIMGFNIAKEWLYIPVFFLNGELKGHELLYLKSKDRFVPCEDGWINEILNKKPHHLGQGIDKSTYRRSMTQPDLSIFSTPPTSYYKRGSYPAKLLPGIAAFAHFTQTSPVTDTKYRDLGQRVDLPTFLKRAGVETTRTFLNWMQQIPELAEAFNRFHGSAKLAEVVAHHKFVNKPGVLSGAKPVTKKASRGVWNHPPQARPNVKQASVYTLDDSPRRLEKLSHEQKADLLRRRMLIVDDRSPTEISRVFRTKLAVEDSGNDNVDSRAPKPRIRTEEGLSNPDQTGVYDVLTGQGKFERCLVLVHPYSHSGAEDMATVVRLTGDRTYINSHTSRIWISLKSSNESLDGIDTELSRFRRWYGEEGAAADSLPEDDDWHVLVGPQGQATVPFRVTDALGESDGYKTYAVRFDRHVDVRRDPAMPKIEPVFSNAPHQYYSRIKLTGKRGGSLNILGGEVQVPAGYRLLDVQDRETGEGCGCLGLLGGGDSQVSEPLRLGTSADLWTAILNKEASLKLTVRSGEASIESKLGECRLSSDGAVGYLVSRHGLTEDTARSLLKEANNRTYRVVVKYADGYPMQDQGPTAPPFPEPMYSGSDPSLGDSGMQMQYPQEEHIPVDMPPSPARVPMTAPPSPEVTMIAQQAAQSGQKEVFDVSMIGGLLRDMREDRIDDDLSGMEDTVDKIGRKVFSFYQHNDTFADRFGKQDLPELEDLLLSNFKGLGDLVLYLKQKSIKPYMDESSVGIDPSNS